MLYQDDAPISEEDDGYIGIKVLFTRGYGYQHKKIALRKQNIDGELIGLHNANPTLHTRVYEAVLTCG